MKNNAAYLLLPVLFIFGCSVDSPMIAGGTSDTGNARVMGRVVHQLHGGAQNLDVALRSIVITRKGDSIVTEDVDTTDTDGRFDFTGISAGKYLLFCLYAAGEEACFRADISLDPGDTQEVELTLRKTLTVVGHVLVAGTLDVTGIIVEVPGTGSAAHPEPDGAFVLENIPREAYHIAFIHDNAVNYLSVDFTGCVRDTAFLNDVLYTDTLGGAAVPFGFYDHTLPAAYAIVSIEHNETSLLFDDFSRGVDHNALRGLLYPDNDPWAGRWVVRPNADGHGVYPAVFPDIFDDAWTDSTAFSDTSLWIEFLYNEGSPPTGGIGVDIGTPEAFYDLSTMTEFSFYARGNGSLRVVYHTDSVGTPTGEGEFIYEFGVPEQWQRISINAADLLPRNGTAADSMGLTWNDVSSHVTSISFFALEDAVLYLDEMYIIGSRIEDLILQSQ